MQVGILLLKNNDVGNPLIVYKHIVVTVINFNCNFKETWLPRSKNMLLTSVAPSIHKRKPNQHHLVTATLLLSLQLWDSQKTFIKMLLLHLKLNGLSSAVESPQGLWPTYNSSEISMHLAS